MNKIINSIKFFDLFGAPITVLTSEKQKEHTSLLGGILSILVATASMGFFIYTIQLWINKEIPPSLNFKQQTNGYAEFSWTDGLIEFSLQDSQYKTNPFSAQNNIITPLLFTVIGDQIQEKPKPLFSKTDSDENTITIQEGTLILNQYDPDPEHPDMQQYLLVFVTCQKQLLPNNSTCASTDVIEEYMTQYHGLLFLTIKLNQFNYVNQSLDVFTKQYYTAFVPNQFSYTQVMLKQQHSIVDDGVLFRNEKDYYFINNYELINQQVDQIYMQNIISYMSNNTFQGNCFASYLFRIDNISVVEEMVMPKLGEVLAQVGSIVQLLFFVKYFVLFYNGKNLEHQLYHDIISMYYPDIKMYTQQKQFVFQKIVFPEEYLFLSLKYKEFLKHAKEKCRLNNLIYEISRIQFILEQQFGSQVLSASHQLGAKITKNEVDDQIEVKESNRLVVKPSETLELRSQIFSVDNLELLIKQT